METTLLAVLTVAVLAVLVLLAVFLLRKPQGSGDLAANMQGLTQSIEDSRREAAAMAAKLERLGPIGDGVSGVQAKVGVLGERISNLEDNLFVTNQALAEVRTDLTKTGTHTEGLVGTARSIQAELSRAQQNLTELEAFARARQDLERRNTEALRHLEAVIAGTHSKGAAGENILDAVFAKLPPEWQVRGLTIKGKTCEFGLRLPNNLVLPIDSKWTATSLLEQFAECGDADEQVRLKGQIEGAVLGKAREVRKYLDPDYTVNFGVAVVPDAVFELCGSALSETFTLNVAVISYSMFIPYLLLVFHTILKATQDVDLEKLNHALSDSEQSIKCLQEELEGRFSRALTMLNNSRNDMSAEVGKLGSRLGSLRVKDVPAAPEVTGDAGAAAALA